MRGILQPDGPLGSVVRQAEFGTRLAAIGHRLLCVLERNFQVLLVAREFAVACDQRPGLLDTETKSKQCAGDAKITSTTVIRLVVQVFHQSTDPPRGPPASQLFAGEVRCLLCRPARTLLPVLPPVVEKVLDGIRVFCVAVQQSTGDRLFAVSEVLHVEETRKS